RGGEGPLGRRPARRRRGRGRSACGRAGSAADVRPANTRGSAGMRPFELRLAGFRSYRSERTVSFRDVDMVAIIGDTGAGKSSLVEAMTWALYGASSWSRRSSAELLAHGARRMSVALEFEAAGERWLVTRTYATSGGGGAQLECLSNPAE